MDIIEKRIETWQFFSLTKLFGTLWLDVVSDMLRDPSFSVIVACEFACNMVSIANSLWEGHLPPHGGFQRGDCTENAVIWTSRSAKEYTWEFKQDHVLFTYPADSQLREELEKLISKKE